MPRTITNSADEKFGGCITAFWEKDEGENKVVMSAVVGRSKSLLDIRRTLESHWLDLKACSRNRQILFQMDMPDGNGGQRRTDIPENSWELVRDHISQVFVKLSTYNPTELDSPPTRNAPPLSASAKPTSSKKRKTKENASDDDEIMAVPDAKPIQRKRKRSINESTFQRAKNVKKDGGVRFQNPGKPSRTRVRGRPLTCNQCKYFKTTCVMGTANAEICRPCVEKGIIYCSLKPGDVGAMEKQCRTQAREYLDASSSPSSDSDGTDTSDESSSD